MKQSEIGKRDVPRCSPTSCARKRDGQAGTSWSVDETSIKVHGKWCSLSRAIDRDGNLVDSWVREKRDRNAAHTFFEQTVEVCGHAPETVTTDGHRSYPRAIRETMGSDVAQRSSKYLNNRLEQDHRGVKPRSYPLRGFGNFDSAARFCRAFDEVRNALRSRHTFGKTMSRMEQRRAFCDKFAAPQLLLREAS